MGNEITEEQRERYGRIAYEKRSGYWRDATPPQYRFSWEDLPTEDIGEQDAMRSAGAVVALAARADLIQEMIADVDKISTTGEMPGGMGEMHHRKRVIGRFLRSFLPADPDTSNAGGQ